ncbi:unnamed protein product [Spodoptera littoralis]|uniref:THAP-type domain-containing protein n=1 Tax=Spodoptera littoralis TaxID=7109 RepID=A0A9P0ICJ9_SPOLI|nr:unnamed protein product [Spodoptera littoralis]CAH1642750.1 unnamed protein product [Spodoptera littoralis]
MPGCSIIGCDTRNVTKLEGVTIHRLPVIEPNRSAWLKIIGVENIHMRKKYVYVCSLHFEDSCFNRTMHIVKLRDGALPSQSLLPSTRPKVSGVVSERDHNEVTTQDPLSDAVLIMGAKTPEQVNKPRTLKCDACERKFVNLQALISHKKFLHTKTETPRRSALKKQEDAKLSKKKVIPVSMLKRVNPPTPAKTPVKTAVDKTPDLAGKDSNQPKKPHFECPVCFKKFPVYFTAFRHIQKNATCCIDEKGNKVPANSTNLVKPIRVEICLTCEDETRSTELHDCPKAPSSIDLYECLGCKQVFNGLQLYQHHVKGLHSDGAQNYFFPSRKEFTLWKKSLQEQTKVEFAQLNRPKAKDVFHCSHQPTKVTDNTQLCPSMIIARTYSKGIHISYLKDHHGHTADSTPLKNYSQYSISLYPREMELKELSDDSELYLQFKNIIMSVAHDAVKADMTMLKELIGKALEMTTLLKGLKNNDLTTATVKKKLSDDQITKTLDSLLTRTGKRKQTVEPKETKKEVPKRLKRNSTFVEITVENNIATAKATPVPKSVTFKNTTKNNETKSDSELSQTDTEDSLKTILKASEVLQNTSKKADDTSETSSSKADDDKKDEPLRSALQSPSSFNDSYMNFVGQNFRSSLESSTPKVRPNIRKKEIMKTKIGQFKAKSLSPREPMSPKSPNKVKNKEKSKEITKENTPTKNWSTKDLKYEVKEQENDYNILILKI